MENNYIPQRGVDFDDFIGSMYFKDQMGLENVQFTPVFCPKNNKHDDDFIGIRYQGYDTKKTGKLIIGIAYPSKQFTKEDIDKLFVKVETEEGVVYRPKTNLTLDEVYVRVCYSHDENKEDNIKWVAAVDGGEVFALHGERRIYTPKEKDAEA